MGFTLLCRKLRPSEPNRADALRLHHYIPVVSLQHDDIHGCRQKFSECAMNSYSGFIGGFPLSRTERGRAASSFEGFLHALNVNLIGAAPSTKEDG